MEFYNDYPKASTAKGLCEAVGCEKEATEQIAVSAGEFGTLILLVCKNCTVKFLDN